MEIVHIDLEHAQKIAPTHTDARGIMNRYNSIINEWLKEHPEIKLTDKQYESLDKRIDQYGDDRWDSGFDTVNDNYD